MKGGGVKLVLLAQASLLSEMVWSYKCFPHVNKMSTLTYNRANSLTLKSVIILNIIHNIFNLRDTEVVLCILLVLLKRASDHHQFLNMI